MSRGKKTEPSSKQAQQERKEHFIISVDMHYRFLGRKKEGHKSSKTDLICTNSITENGGFTLGVEVG